MIRNIIISAGAVAAALAAIWGSWAIATEIAPWPLRGELERLERDHIVVAGDYYASQIRDNRAGEAQTRALIRDCDKSGCKAGYRTKLDNDLRFYQQEQRRLQVERERYRAKQRKEN